MNDVGPDDEALRLARRAALVWCPCGTLQTIGSGSGCNRMGAWSRGGARVALAADILHVIDFDALPRLAAGTRSTDFPPPAAGSTRKGASGRSTEARSSPKRLSRLATRVGGLD